MESISNQNTQRLLAAIFALVALVALVALLARPRASTPIAQSQPAFAVVKTPGGGQRVVQIQAPHATTQTSPGGQTQLVSAVGPNGTPVLISQPAGGGSDR
jgi:hypothetical protein